MSEQRVKKRKRVPLWRAQLYIWRFYHPPQVGTLPVRVLERAFFSPLLLTYDPPNCLAGGMGERAEYPSGVHPGGEAAFAGLKRDWTKL